MMQDVNTYCLAFKSSDGHSLFKHNSAYDANGEPVNNNTIFEGASLSKTVFAYLFWQLRKKYPALKAEISAPLCAGDSIKIDPLWLLRHSMRSDSHCLVSTQADTFLYSENNYLLLQSLVERITGKDLQTLAYEYVFRPLKMKRSSFVWNESYKHNYVDGHYDSKQIHRRFRVFKEPKANGTLYTNASDMSLFATALMQSDVPDSILRDTIPVNGYSKLAWGNGMGTDNSLGHPILWQWGSNWSYNHILIIDREKNYFLIVLSNSISGAKSLRNTCNTLFDNNLELFNYINWY